MSYQTHLQKRTSSRLEQMLIKHPFAQNMVFDNCEHAT
jgi:hypothetical protein